jgi:HEAT repeat protein
MLANWTSRCLLALWAAPFAALGAGEPAREVEIKEQVRTILDGLETKDVKTVAAELRQLGPAAADELFKNTAEKIGSEWRGRQSAACRGALIALGDPASIALVRYLRSPDDEERRRAIDMIRLTGAKSRVDDVIRLLSHSDFQTRANAANALGSIADRRAALPLLAMMQNDENGLCRYWAARALGALGPEGLEVADAVFEMIRSIDQQPYPPSRYAEAHWCSVLGNFGPTTMDKFMVILGPRSQCSEDVKWNALFFIPVDEEPKVATGREVSKLLLDYIRSDNAELAHAATTKLCLHVGLAVNIRDELEEFASKADTDLRNQIAACLWRGGVHSENVMQMILSGLRNDDEHGQIDSLETLCGLDLPIRVVKPFLLRLAKSLSAAVRRTVIETIGEIGPYDQFAGELRNIIESDKDEEVVADAKIVLARLEDKFKMPER